MNNLNLKYKIAKKKAIELMNLGLIKEYIEQLKYVHTLKMKLATLSNQCYRIVECF